jgi:hypothetical protein
MSGWAPSSLSCWYSSPGIRKNFSKYVKKKPGKPGQEEKCIEML